MHKYARQSLPAGTAHSAPWRTSCSFSAQETQTFLYVLPSASTKVGSMKTSQTATSDARLPAVSSGPAVEFSGKKRGVYPSSYGNFMQHVAPCR
ncbi:hypothetical protein AMECASPLE_012870 [Ameca splendens]|uniref:Uncharacterized protein n=1 Tax=Ameca splendens TaxID=208324 RepID=A0ABV0XQ45_9TELE